MKSDLVSVTETLSVSVHNRKSEISSDGAKRAGTPGLSEAAPPNGECLLRASIRMVLVRAQPVTRTVGSVSSCLCEDKGLPGDVFPTVGHWLTWE